MGRISSALLLTRSGHRDARLRFPFAVRYYTASCWGLTIVIDALQCTSPSITLCGCLPCVIIPVWRVARLDIIILDASQCTSSIRLLVGITHFPLPSKVVSAQSVGTRYPKSQYCKAVRNGYEIRSIWPPYRAYTKGVDPDKKVRGRIGVLPNIFQLGVWGAL